MSRLISFLPNRVRETNKLSDKEKLFYADIASRCDSYGCLVIDISLITSGIAVHFYNEFIGMLSSLEASSYLSHFITYHENSDATLEITLRLTSEQLVSLNLAKGDAI